MSDQQQPKSVLVRVPGEVHAYAKAAAAIEQMSLQDWVADALYKAAQNVHNNIQWEYKP